MKNRRIARAAVVAAVLASLAGVAPPANAAPCDFYWNWPYNCRLK